VSDFDSADSASDEEPDLTPSPLDAPRSHGVEAAAISPEHYRATLGHFCTGVTIITAAGDDGPAGFTCQSFSALSLDPPLILICPGRGSTSWPKVEAAGAFVVNVLAEDQEDLCRGFAMKGVDKFAGVGWSPAAASGAPIIHDCLAWIECRLDGVLDGGDHVIAVGRVLEMQATTGRPLLFYRGGYGRFEV
jgi:3-hydroxy-9,10-secoandrosta-1,3,5(10)-triene-9,17-dione monooxygenase reductase component